jgi:tetratricopeptide (TPR) repeat protein
MAETFTPVEIFCCYSHVDEVWLRKLQSHLSLLKRQGLISLWYDRLIVPGINWAQAIDRHLETASVILLLVSANFLASDYCYSIEMKRALERQEAGEARVVPVLVRPVDWRGAPFAHLQALPTDARPLSTWRDADRALADVAAGIRRVIEDMPLLAASALRAALPVIWNIPYPRNPFFLGREDELANVRSSLQGGQTTAVSQPQAISRLGGIGKTQLALEYAYRYHQDYQAILWARAESTEAVVSSYVAISSLLRLPECDAKEQEVIVQAVKTWLQTHRGWLLILDNADELALLRDFLPPSLGGHLLLTTRAAATGRLAHRLEIATLLPEQGALFLLRRAALIAPDATLEQVSPQERELAMQLSQELGGLPLALDQAGAYLEETGVDLIGYWHLYQQHRADLLRERRGLVADHPWPVATTWSLSFKQVEERNPAAADLLRLLAFLAPDAIPEEILTAGASFLGPVLAPVAADAFLLNQAIEALRTNSLVRRDPGGKTLSIHRLVQVVLQDRLSEAQRRSWAERAMLSISAAFPPDPFYENWPRCERLLPQALMVAQMIERYQIIGKQAGDLLNKTAAYLSFRTRYIEAEPLLQQRLRFWERQVQMEDLRVEYGHDFSKLSIFYITQYFDKDSEVASSLSFLGDLYHQQGKYAEAEPLLQRALHIREQRLESDDEGVATALAALGDLYYQQGKYAEAEPLLQRALHIREQRVQQAQQAQLRSSDLPVAERPVVTDLLAIPLMRLGNLYQQQGKYAEAEPLYQRALSIWEQQWGPENLNVAWPLTSLGDLNYQQGKYAEAEPLLQHALHIREQTLGPEHPEVAYSLSGLANLYREQGKFAEAELLLQRALHIREQEQGSQHSETADTMHDLAQLREVQGNSEEARVWYARALAMYEQELGVRAPKTTKTRKRLIVLLHTLGQHEQAAQLEMAQAEP